jgi:hypothetical protein
MLARMADTIETPPLRSVTDDYHRGYGAGLRHAIEIIVGVLEDTKEG